MGALIPLVLSLAPEIGKWLFGSKGEQTAQVVAQVVQTVTGTTDEAVAQQVIARDPEKAAQLRVQLAQIAADREKAERAADLDALKAQLSDVAGARAQTVDLAKSGSRVAWAPVLISAIVLIAFAAVCGLVLFRAVPAGSEQVATMLLGTLATMAGSAVAYWLGSSAGSDKKTDLLAKAPPVQQ